MVAGRPVPMEFVYCIFEGARCGTVQYYTRKVGTVRTSGSATALRLALEKPAMAAGTKLTVCFYWRIDTVTTGGSITEGTSTHQKKCRLHKSRVSVTCDTFFGEYEYIVGCLHRRH